MHFFDLKIPRFTAAILVIAAILTHATNPVGALISLGVIGVVGGGIAHKACGDHRLSPAFLALVLVPCAVGYTQAISARSDVIGRTISGQDALVLGRIVKGASLTPSGWTHTMALTSVDGRSIDLRGQFHSKRPLVAGDRVEVYCEILAIGHDDFPTLVSFRQRLLNRGVGVRLRARERPRRLAAGASPRSWVEARRIRFETRISNALAPRQAGFALALLTGNKRLLDGDDVLNFADTGTAHVLAISGLHFGVVGVVIWWLVGLVANRFPTWVARHGRRRLCGLGVSIALSAYLIFVGAPVSAIRAWTIANVLILGLVLRRQNCSANSLAAAASVIVLADPWMVRDIGFHLSFAAAAGILTFLRHPPAMLSPPPFTQESFWARWLRHGLSFVGVSIAATLATTPVLAAHFGTVSLGAFWTNLIVVPLVSSLFFPLVLIGAIGASVLMPGGIEVLSLGVSGFEWMSAALGVVCSWEWNLWVVGTIGWPAAGALTVAVFLVLSGAGRPSRLLWSAALTCVCAMGLSFGQIPDAAIHFIPVGQGDSTLVQVGERNYLVDGGGRMMGSDPGQKIVLPFLRRLGVSKLDAAVVSHWDIDHYGGLVVIQERMSVDTWVVGEPHPKLKAKAPIQVNERARVGDLLILRAPAGLSENDRSLVVLVPGLALLPGDLEALGEAHVGASGLAPVPILKIPHHGSSTSSSAAFVKQTSPRVAVWSAGVRNRFGHPNPDVVRAYRSQGISVWGTANQGWVAVEKRRGTLRVKTAR